MKKEQETPNRFNDLYDHSKDGAEALGISEKEFQKALSHVNMTCCSMESDSHSIEDWCDVLTKKEMALIIKHLKHEPIIEGISKRLVNIMGSMPERKPDPKDGTPHRDNDIYDHSAETMDETLGIGHDEMKAVLAGIEIQVNPLQDQDPNIWTEIIQKSTTHKQLAVLYTATIVEKFENPVIRMLRNRLGGE